MTDLNRRDFVKTTGALLGASMLPTLAAAKNPTAGADELRVMQIGVGGVGGMDRGQINNHPKARIVGLVDVDKNNLEKVGQQFPESFREMDYRKAFADHKDKFDAVNICTPDHNHAVQILAALEHDKHVYAQKPLVQQLEELTMIDKAMAAKPFLATQTGNQRMNNGGRRLAAQILQKDLLGRAIEAHVWTGSVQGRFTKSDLPGPQDPPAHIDWNLWLGPAEEQPYRPGIAPGNWRKWWDFGTSGMGDWGVHLLDIIMYSYPELVSPVSVRTHTPRTADWMHAAHCQSSMTYLVDSDRFARDFFPVHYSDSNLSVSMRALGIDGEGWKDSNTTVVVCEEGVLTLTAGGGLQVYQGGKRVNRKDIKGITEPGGYNHWHGWVDRALGDKDAEVWTPFDVAVRITEASILPVKACRFPNKELHWDRKSLTFTNNQEATDKVVRRKYRDGFAPPKAYAS